MNALRYVYSVFARIRGFFGGRNYAVPGDCRTCRHRREQHSLAEGGNVEVCAKRNEEVPTAWLLCHGSMWKRR